MECDAAGEYMMKYMDGILSDHEAELLNRHIGQCSRCKEDFLIYDGIMADFSKMEIVEAPDGFEELVMAKIRTLPVPEVATDSVLCVIWGAFSVLMGLGFIITMNKEAIMEWLSLHPQFDSLMAYLQPLSVTVANVSASMTASFQSMAAQMSQVFSGFRYVLLVIFGLLAVVQYFVYRKARFRSSDYSDERDKVEA
ncbi:MAG: zf-HC2 domain-containing protein [Clostridiales bacterium]|jgi:anti-sigma factor RsiW|nr:zf-HC2 domain-containing protein [Clostridiales bacterium]